MELLGAELSSLPLFGSSHALETVSSALHSLPSRRSPILWTCASREGGPWTPRAHRLAVRLGGWHAVLSWSQ